MAQLLGDSPGALFHGNKRAPRTKAEMTDLVQKCITPIHKQLITRES